MALPQPVVVTGACGFIGSNLVRRLVAEDNNEVRAVIHVGRQPEAERAKALAGASVMGHNLAKARGAADAVAGAGTVFHLAADMGGVGWFHSDKDFGSSTLNGIITANVLRACAEMRVERLVYASSACTYPIERQGEEHLERPVRFSEDLRHHGTPDALYGAEKRHGMRLCEGAPFDARVGILHTVYGPLQEHAGQRMKFPAAVATKALRARETGVLELWGDGRQMRSYLYVDDAVERLIRLASADVNPGPINVGFEGAVSCLDIARMCLRIVGAPDAEIVLQPDGPVGVWARDCDNTKWLETFGPTCDVGYEEGFGRFMAWLEGVL